VQAISYRNMFSHHQKTVILDAPMDAAAAVEEGVSADALPSIPPVSTAPVDPATLDNLGTPEGSPRHAGGKDKGHRHPR
jgi:hypothetical protein